MLMWLLGYANMGAKHGRETLIRNAKTHCRSKEYSQRLLVVCFISAFVPASSLPILAFPEGASTNGKKGLLKFRSVVVTFCDDPYCSST